MKIIRPITITDAMMTASNVPDVDDIGTSATSLLIAIASKTFTTQAGLPFLAGEWVKAYSAATPTNYMYGKITSYTGTTLVVDMSVNGGSGTPADWKISYGWNVSAAYLDGDTVQLSTTNNHRIYEAIVNVTGGSSPEIDVLATVPKWLEVSATNRWKAFDLLVGSQTEQATSITFQITPAEVIDSIAFLNVDATTIRVVSTDPVYGEVYDETFDTISSVITGTSSVYDWYSYFFSAQFKLADYIIQDLPPYLNTVLDITIASDATVKVGAIVLGVLANLGETQYSPNVGIHDYSYKQQDAFGVWAVIQRSFSKKMSCDILIEKASIADVQNLLAYYRTTSLVWIGSEEYSSTIIYGYYKDFNIVIGYPTFAICSIEIEGLT